MSAPLCARKQLQPFIKFIIKKYNKIGKMKITPPLNPHQGASYGPRKERHSGMELLRIIAMFLVLVVHADYFSLGVPIVQDVQQNTWGAFARIFFQSLSVGCVNLFVLLSGWFGIRPKPSSFLNLMFQCAYFLFGIYAICLMTGVSQLNIHGLMGCLLLLKWNWFIKAYILLFIMAPILNSYIDNTTQRQHGLILVGFYIFQTIYSWFSGAAVFFDHGYSTISFMGLYLLARYFAKYPMKITSYARHFYLLFFLLSVLFMAIGCFAATKYGLSAVSGRIFQYDQPLIIVASMSLIIYFSKLSFRSRIVNWIAASSFAVFLLHTNPNLCEQIFVPIVKTLYNSYSGIRCIIAIFVFLIAVYMVAILMDQPRKIMWSKIKKRLE